MDSTADAMLINQIFFSTAVGSSSPIHLAVLRVPGHSNASMKMTTIAFIFTQALTRWLASSGGLRHWASCNCVASPRHGRAHAKKWQQYPCPSNFPRANSPRTCCLTSWIVQLLSPGKRRLKGRALTSSEHNRWMHFIDWSLRKSNNLIDWSLSPQPPVPCSDPRLWSSMRLTCAEDSSDDDRWHAWPTAHVYTSQAWLLTGISRL